jgi:ssDNA-binding Zn-finger/Zn-ribbon topoisomerase 1
MSDEKNNIIQNFILALDEELKSQRKKSSEESISLENGEKTASASDKSIYTFFIEEDLKASRLKDDTPVTLVVNDEETYATIVSIGNRKIVVSTDKDFGKRLPIAQIKFDSSYLTERLKKCFEDKIDGNNSPINIETIEKSFLQKKSEIAQVKPNIDQGTLNDQQYNAVKAAHGSQVTYIWGPPGTGKTYCISKIVESFYLLKKRVLLVSNTNSAVDIVMKELCTRLDEKKDKDFDRGSVLRYGDIINETLKNKYASYINIDLAAERLSKELVDKKNVLLKKIEKLRLESKPHLTIVTAFKNIDRLYNQNKKDLSALEKLNNFLKDCNDLIGEIGYKIKTNKENLEASKNRSLLGKVFSKGPEFYERLILSDSSKLDGYKENKKNYPKKIKEIEEKLTDVKKEISKSELIIKGKNLETEEKKLKKYNDEIDIEDLKVQEIIKKIEQVKTEVLNNCRVLASTSTKVYLKPEDFSNFDIVVIDEASMLILPNAAYAASLSKDKVIFAGDFRQIPPIISAQDNELVKRWVGRSVFDEVKAEEIIEKKAKNFVTLTNQYRMHKKICAIINKHFYDGRLTTDDSVKIEKKYPKLLNDNLILINTASAYPFVNMPKRSFSRYNIIHALAVRNLCNYLNEHKIITDSDSVGVTSPYKYQTLLIKDALKELNLTDVACGTVHSFQGDQKNVIIFDIPDSHGAFPGKFIKAVTIAEDGAKVMNVAMSRPKDILIIFANLEYLNQNLAENSILRKIFVDIENKGTIIDIKEILNLGPFNLPSKPSYSVTPKVNFDEKNTGSFNAKNFEPIFEKDIEKAKKYIIIFSAFLTEKRVASWGDLLRKKIDEGVKIRVVTKGPANQSSFKDSATKGIKHLLKLKVIVDLRKDIHQKMIFIDDEILWFGSLNVLSYTGETDEQLIRFFSKSFVNFTAKQQLLKLSTFNEDKKSSMVSLLAVRENNSCLKCGSITEVLFRNKDRVPFLRCIEGACKNMQDMNATKSSTGKRAAKNNGRNIDEGIEEEKRYCPDHKVLLKLRRGRRGPFYGCPKYPKCKHTENP